MSELGIAIVPCPYCHSEFPLVHESDCYLIRSQDLAKKQGYRDGLKVAADLHKTIPIPEDLENQEGGWALGAVVAYRDAILALID